MIGATYGRGEHVINLGITSPDKTFVYEIIGILTNEIRSPDNLLVKVIKEWEEFVKVLQNGIGSIIA